MEPKQHTYECTDRFRNGLQCDRKIGPYYDKALFVDAVTQHRMAQHANELPSMRREEPGDARIRQASSVDVHARIEAERETRERGRRHGNAF